MRVELTAKFKKDYKIVKKRGLDVNLLLNVIELIKNDCVLDDKYRDHQLVNSRLYVGMRECHIQPDWLLIYKIFYNDDVVKLIRTGSHSDLF